MLWVGLAWENSWYFATPPLVGHLPFPHLHGQPGQITVWANVTQNSKKGKFPRRIALTIWPNQFHSPKNGCGGVNLVSKMTWRNGTQSSVQNIPFRKTGQTFQMFHCSRKRSAETTQKIVFHLLSTWVFQKRLVNGKKPMSEECLQKFHTGEVSPPRSV